MFWARCSGSVARGGGRTAEGGLRASPKVGRERVQPSEEPGRLGQTCGLSSFPGIVEQPTGPGSEIGRGERWFALEGAMRDVD
jgi:hypothetical protein